MLPRRAFVIGGARTAGLFARHELPRPSFQWDRVVPVSSICGVMGICPFRLDVLRLFDAQDEVVQNVISRSLAYRVGRIPVVAAPDFTTFKALCRLRGFSPDDALYRFPGLDLGLLPHHLYDFSLAGKETD